MRKLFKIIIKLSIFCFLTVLTQIGGVVFLLSLLINNFWKKEFKFKVFLIFITNYLFFTFLIIPSIASTFGREKVAHSDKVHPSNYLTILLNRNYVKHNLNSLLEEVANDLEGTNIEISYLDANFPFINKFPLLPHLSHNDGEKIDISLIYENEDGIISNKQKSISGYGAFVHPIENEFNQTDQCKSKGYFQYDYPKYLTFGKINSDLKFSKEGTKKLLKNFLKSRGLGKVFIEPHLKKRLNLSDSRIRFQGCRAVRHDDHIHIQL